MNALYNSGMAQEGITVTAARASKEACRAAWVAAGSPRGDNPLFVAACAATKALAAAEQAAQAAAAPAASAGIDAVLARQVRTAKAERADAALLSAQRRYIAAQEWPRCGQDWPAGPAEVAAQRLMEAAGVAP